MNKLLRPMKFIIILFSLLLISGCWDSKEVEDLAITTIIGWDKITENNVDLWQVSARILNLTGKGKDESAQKSSGTEILVKGTGPTAQDALKDLSNRLPGSIFFQQKSVEIIGERVAKEELPNLMGNILRFPEVRLRTFILVTPGEAFHVLQTKPELASLLSLEIRRLTDQTSEQNGISHGVTILQFSKWLLRPDRDAVLPMIKLFYPEKGEESVQETVVLEGFGVIRKSQLIGWLNPEESLGYLLITRKSRDSRVPIEVTYDHTTFSYFLTSYKSSIKSKWVNGTPKFTIKITTSGVLHEIDQPILESNEFPALEEAAAQRIREIALAAIAKAKRYNADFLGLTEKLHRFHPSAWREIETDWHESFNEADIEVEVDTKLINFGTASRKFDFAQ